MTSHGPFSHSRLARWAALAWVATSGLAACDCGSVLRNATPKISVSPARVDFGTVGVGTVADQPIEVTNAGQAPLTITGVTLSNTHGDITIPMSELLVSDCNDNPRTVMNVMQIPSGNCARISVQYAPKAIESVSNVIYIASNDTLHPKVSVPVTAKAAHISCTGSDAPVAKIQATVGNAPIGASVLPLTTVTLSGADSVAPAGSTITGYAWKLLMAPANNMSQVTPANAKTGTLQCTLSGTYQVQLTVTTSNGCTGTATTNIQVVPGAGIHVELTWPETYGDLDLHYVGPGGSFYDEPRDEGGMGTDLFFPYANSTFDGTTLTPNPTLYVLDWGLNGSTRPDNTTVDDPTLDVDQVWGKGPENITHPRPFDATYSIMVHYYCSSAYDQVQFYGGQADLGPDPNCGADGRPCKDFGKTTATVTVYFNGKAEWTGEQQLSAKQVWDAATITVSSNGNTVDVKPGTTAVSRVMQGCEDGN